MIRSSVTTTTRIKTRNTPTTAMTLGTRQSFEATHERVEDVGEDAGGQEGQQHAADLAHEGHQEHHAHGQHDVLEVCRDDQFSGGHPVSDPISTTTKYTSPANERGASRVYTPHPPLYNPRPV